MLFYLRLAKNIFLILLIIDMVTNNAWGFSSAAKVWDSEGVPVTIAAGNELRSTSTKDGTGGALIFWEDDRISHGITDIYGQRTAASGSRMWGSNGTPLVNALNIYDELTSQRNPKVISDGSGGAIFTWEDNRFLQADIFAQRVDISGEVKWQENGIPISTSCWTTGPPCTNHKHNPQIISDGVGGGIITWYEIRDGYNFSIWAQRVNADGAVLWEKDGIPIVMGKFHADFPKIVSDGSNGAIIVWQDGRNVTYDGTYRIYAQHIDSKGIIQWAVNGIEISPGIASRGLDGHSVIADAFGGSIISWVDGRKQDSNDADIYAQRINGNGQVQWMEGGVPVCTRQLHQYSPKLSTNNAGGAFIVWEDQGASPPGSGQQWLYMQQISKSGQIQWASNGIPIYMHHSHNPNIINDNAEGAIIVWDTIDNSDPFAIMPILMSQHVTARGEILWPNGFVVYSQIGNYQFGPKIISDGMKSAIVHWTDYRNSNTAWDIYAQKITFEPVISNRAMPWIPLLLFED